MFQSKKDLLLGSLKKNRVKGLANLGMLFVERGITLNKLHSNPHSMVVEVSTHCNLKCKMCINPHLKRGGYLDINNFKKLIDSNPYIQKITVNGMGEPLLNPDFFEIVKYAKNKGIYTWFVSNMTLMNEKNIQRLLDAKADSICASLDGANKKTFENIRKGAKFEDIVNNTKKIIQMRNKKPTVGINMAITKENYREIEEIIKLASEIKVDYVSFRTAYLRPEDINSLSFDSISKKELNKILLKAKATAKRLKVKVSDWPKTKMSKKTGCNVPWTNPGVAYNGDVFPCCYALFELEGRTRDENIVGNVFKEDLSKIWNNEKYINFRKKIKTNLPPVSCRLCPSFYGIQ